MKSPDGAACLSGNTCCSNACRSNGANDPKNGTCKNSCKSGADYCFATSECCAGTRCTRYETILRFETQSCLECVAVGARPGSTKVCCSGADPVMGVCP